MKTAIRAGYCCAALAVAALCADAVVGADDPVHGPILFHGPILMEYAGQVINGAPAAASSNQFGNLRGVVGKGYRVKFRQLCDEGIGHPIGEVLL